MTLSTDLGEKTLGEISGLHKETKVDLQTLNDTLNKILTAVTGISTNAISGLNGDNGIIDPEKIFDSLPGGDKDKDKDKKSKGDDGEFGKKGKTDVKLGDLKDIPSYFSSGPALISSQLTNMQKTLTKMLNALQKGGTGGKAIKDKATKDGGGKAKEKIDIKQMGNVAKGMMEYAKACMVLALIPGPMVKAAVKSFEFFINKMVDAANKLNENGESFNEFAKGIQTIVKALKQFTLVIFLMALVLVFVPLALLTGLGMMGIIKMVQVMAKMVKGLENEIGTLQRTFVQMGITFILFGIASLIAIIVGKSAMDAIKGLGVMILFTITFIILGLLTLLAMTFIGISTAAFIGMAVAAVLFGVAVLIIQNIPIDQKKIDNFIFAVKTITTAFMELLPIIFKSVLGVLGFMLFGVLLIVGTLAFTLSLVFLILTDLLLRVLYKPDESECGFPVIDKIKSIATVFGENFEMFLLAAVGSLGFMIFAIALFIAALFSLIAFALLLVVGMIIESDSFWNADHTTPKAIEAMVLLGSYMVDNIKTFALGALVAIPAILFAGLLVVFSVLSLVAFAALYETKKIVDKIGTTKEIVELGKKMKDAGIGVMLAFLGLEFEEGDEIGAGTLLKGGLNAAKMAALAVEALVAVVPMAAFMVSAALIGTSLKSLQNSLKDFNPKTLEALFGVLALIMANLRSFAWGMKDTSADTISAIGGLVKDVAEAINMLTDIVIKLKDGIPEEQIDAATSAMNRICERLFGAPGVEPGEGQYTLTTTLETIARADLQDLNAEAVGAITPLMGGLDKMADLIIKLADPNTFSIEKIETGISNMSYFLAAMKDVSNAMMGLVMKEATGEVIAGKHWWNSDTPVLKSPLEAVQEVVNSGFFNSLDTVMGGLKKVGTTLSSFQTEPLQRVVDFLNQGGVAAMAKAGSIFLNAMGDFTDGINKLKKKSLDNFREFIDMLSGQNTDNLTKTVDSLARLGEAASKFEKLGSSFEKMEKALTKMAKQESAITKVFNAMKSGGEQGAAMATSATAAVNGTSTNDPYVQSIYEILDEWKEDGVPIQGKINDDKTIEPKDMDNATGKGKKRNK